MGYVVLPMNGGKVSLTFTSDCSACQFGQAVSHIQALIQTREVAGTFVKAIPFQDQNRIHRSPKL